MVGEDGTRATAGLGQNTRQFARLQRREVCRDYSHRVGTDTGTVVGCCCGTQASGGVETADRGFVDPFGTGPGGEGVGLRISGYDDQSAHLRGVENGVHRVQEDGPGDVPPGGTRPRPETALAQGERLDRQQHGPAAAW
nr:hypothetical protein [Streptomyces malaysiensis]